MYMSHIVTLPWVIPVVCGSTVAIVAILSGVIGDCFKSVARTNLKQTMVENGYSVEQIDHVLAAGETSGKARKKKRPSATKGYA